jgi:hypothetical protein
MASVSNTSLKRFLEHPDKDELISKSIIGLSPKEINEWLSAKYSDVAERKFVISEKTIKSFQENYLDVYQQIRDDVLKSKTAIQMQDLDKELRLSVSDNPNYKSLVMGIADTEIRNAVNVERILAGMIKGIENKTAQFYDEIQASGKIDTRTERVLIEWFEVLGSSLERWHKFTHEGPDQIIQHNVNIQNNLDQYVSVIYEAIRETLSQMDLETSLYFMDIFSEKIAKLRLPTEAKLTQEQKTAEVKLLNETISQKLSEPLNG